MNSRVKIPETRTYSVPRSPDTIICPHNGFKLEHSSRWEEKPKPVRTKKDFYRRFYKGEFGNYGPMWETLQEWKVSQYKGKVAIRSLEVGGPCKYNINPENLIEAYIKFQNLGYPENRLNISAMAPDTQIDIQGEVAEVPGVGLYAFVSRAKLPMRQALKEGKHYFGLQVDQILSNTMDPVSWNWVKELLMRYPNHTIEFSTFRVPWGVIRGLNTVIWEVRQY